MTDPRACPLCGHDNACGMLQGAAICWCQELTIPAELLARIPDEAKGVACVCKQCVLDHLERNRGQPPQPKMDR